MFIHKKKTPTTPKSENKMKKSSIMAIPNINMTMKAKTYQKEENKLKMNLMHNLTMIQIIINKMLNLSKFKALVILDHKGKNCNQELLQEEEKEEFILDKLTKLGIDKSTSVYLLKAFKTNFHLRPFK